MIRKGFHLGPAAVLCLLLGSSTASASSIVFGIQATTGNILTIDPTTGGILNTFATPAAIAAGDVAAGLTYAAPLGELLYFNQSVSTTLYRLNPTTGAQLSTAVGDVFANSGLSYEQIGGVNSLYYAHTSIDLHRQNGFGGGFTVFFGPLSPTAGLGGDGYGREFAVAGGLIREYNPSTGALIGAGFATPANAMGLAFDGTFLYVSTSQGLLLTLNADTGALLNSVTVGGGALIELGAAAQATAVPEPASVLLMGAGLAVLAAARRFTKRR